MLLHYCILICGVLKYSVGKSELLFRSGWYKDDEKGPKFPISNVPYIDSHVVPDSKYLRIRSKITTLQIGSVRNLSNVMIFKLVSCEILIVESGAFLNLPNLATLSLNDNDIEHINKGVFNYLYIMRLFLHRNNIQSIDSGAFDNMPKLQMLKLNSNKITALDSNWFKNTPQITDLYLRRNELTDIPSEAFKNMKGGHNINGTEFMDVKLFLSKNFITSIQPSAFQGLKVLNQLWLDRNDLEEIDDRVFGYLEYIGVLFLSKNKLTRLPKNLMLGLKMDVMTLDLAGNKNISCLDYDIVSRVKITNLEKIHRLDCQCIEVLLNSLMIHRQDNEIKTECKNNKKL